MPLTRPRHYQLQTSITNFDDPLIELNASHTGTNTNDLGILFNRGSSGNNVGIIWDRSAQAFALMETSDDGSASGDIILTDYAPLQVKTIETENFSFPAADGTDGQVLTTDGLGNVTFETLPAASETASGVVELATQTEVNTGTDTSRAVTPATVSNRIIDGGSYV